MEYWGAGSSAEATIPTILADIRGRSVIYSGGCQVSIGAAATITYALGALLGSGSVVEGFTVASNSRLI